MNVIGAVSPLRKIPDTYDMFIAAVGYESRARHLAVEYGLRGGVKVAAAFGDRQEMAFDHNRTVLASLGFDIEQVEDREFASWVKACFERFPSALRPPRIAVDISSLSRFRMATIVAECTAHDKPIYVDFLYSLAAYSPPAREHLPNVHVGPVEPRFAGWSVRPEDSLSAIVGLGYEQDRALGAIEHVQASRVWAFVPSSSITAYSGAVARANRTFLDIVNQKITYKVDRPFDCFVVLESLTSGLINNESVMLFPFGPKVFAICSLLVATVHSSVAVWRVSSGRLEAPVDRVPSGLTAGLSVAFTPAASRARIVRSPNVSNARYV